MFFSNNFITCAFGRFVVGLGIGISGLKFTILFYGFLKKYVFVW